MTEAPNLSGAATNKTEWKVKVASYGTFFASLAGTALLTTTVTDLVHALPDWAEVIIYPSVLGAVSWLSGRAAKTKPEKLSQSTIDAVQDWIAKRAPRYPR